MDPHPGALPSDGEGEDSAKFIGAMPQRWGICDRRWVRMNADILIRRFRCVNLIGERLELRNYHSLSRKFRTKWVTKSGTKWGKSRAKVSGAANGATFQITTAL